MPALTFMHSSKSRPRRYIYMGHTAPQPIFRMSFLNQRNSKASEMHSVVWTWHQCRDSWLARDDIVKCSRVHGRRTWRFPSMCLSAQIDRPGKVLLQRTFQNFQPVFPVWKIPVKIRCDWSFTSILTTCSLLEVVFFRHCPPLNEPLRSGDPGLGLNLPRRSMWAYKHLDVERNA